MSIFCVLHAVSLAARAILQSLTLELCKGSSARFACLLVTHLTAKARDIDGVQGVHQCD